MAKRTILSGETSVGTLLSVEDEVWAAVADVIRRAGARVQSKAQALSPFLTGKLSRSVKLKVFDGKWGPRATIGTSSFIGRFWEIGFGGKTGRVRRNGKTFERKIPRQQHPFLKPALDQYRDQIRGEIKMALGV